MAHDIGLDNDLDLKIADGDLVITESVMQEVALIISAPQGEFKNEPFIGADLPKHIRTGATRETIRREVTFQLQLDEKDYDDVKDLLKINN